MTIVPGEILSKDCEKCEGTGMQKIPDGWTGECKHCDGKGDIPTDTGHMLIRFFKVHVMENFNAGG